MTIPDELVEIGAPTCGGMGMRLWIDDERPPPDDSWHWEKTSTGAMEFVLHHDPTEVSFDHDLGDGGDTRRIADAILGLAHGGQRGPPLRWYVHSANPVGKEYLEGVLERADRYWRRHVTQQNLAASYKNNRSPAA